MSRKILISFLGTGPGVNREYSKVSYLFDKNEYVSSFVTTVIAEHLKIDNIIIIGTVRSMWEELYRHYIAKNNLIIDEEYYVNLGDAVCNSNHLTRLDSFSIDTIEKVIGGRSKCVLIPYGLNRDEPIEIFRRISSAIDSVVDEGDEIILDITHSFRSLPLYSTSVINYLNEVLGKKVSVNKVVYGMLDVRSEFEGKVPIIDISTTLELANWSKAAYSFKEYGKGYLLADLIDNEKSNAIRNFSDALGINYLAEIKTRLTNFKDLAESDMNNEFSNWLLPSVLNEFVDRLHKVGNKHYLFQLELAKWHMEKRNYASSYIVLLESIVSYVCELENLDWKIFKNREIAKTKIINYKDLFKIYQKVNLIRKNIAHNLSKRPDSIKSDIESLGGWINAFSKLTKKTKT